MATDFHTDFAAGMDSDSSLTELSSDLSSIGSPPPVLGYPSPNSSQDVDDVTSDAASKKRVRPEGEEAAPKKKRKRPEPKPRTTERLDLTGQGPLSLLEQSAQLELLLKVLCKRRKIVVIAGAGISVSAGIPDFRSSTGLFKSLKRQHKLKASGKQLFDASVYQDDKSTGAFHEMVRNLSGMVSAAQPTAFHHMLAALGQEGRLLRLYTQNVDGIDVALPSLETTVPLPQKGPWPRTVQLHGGLERMVCTKCNMLSNFEANLFDGPTPPACQTCIEADKIRTDHAGKRSHGIGRLRPRMVLYNEHNPDEEAIGAVMSADLRARPDAIIVVGTSMKIPGVRRIVREMCGVVRGRRDGLAIWINQDAPPPGKDFEDCWDLIVKGPCDDVAQQWRVREHPPHTECTHSDVERAREAARIEVVVKTPQKAKNTGIMTPAASPMPKALPTVKLIVKKPSGSNATAQPPKKMKRQRKLTAKAKESDALTKPKVPRKRDIPTEGSDEVKAARITSKFKVSKSVNKPHKLSDVFLRETSPPDSSAFRALDDVNPASKAVPPRPCSSIEPVMLPDLAPLQLPDRTTPRSLRTDSSYSSPLTELSSSLICDDFSPLSRPVPPRTPPGAAAQSPTIDQLGTVSPTSVPRGMESLLS